MKKWEVPLIGKHQKYNSALAALCAAKIFDIDDVELITDGIKNVVKNTKLQGRYEIVSKEPYIILDSAHNHDGISCLIDEFKIEKGKHKESSLLFGAMKDKNIEEMLKKVKDSFDSFYFYEFNNERSASIALLTEYADKLSIKFEIITNLKEFLIIKLKGDKRNCLVVAGSMYLVGEVKSVLAELLS